MTVYGIIKDFTKALFVSTVLAGVSIGGYFYFFNRPEFNKIMDKLQSKNYEQEQVWEGSKDNKRLEDLVNRLDNFEEKGNLEEVYVEEQRKDEDYKTNYQPEHQRSLPSNRHPNTLPPGFEVGQYLHADYSRHDGQRVIVTEKGEFRTNSDGSWFWYKDANGNEIQSISDFSSGFQENLKSQEQNQQYRQESRREDKEYWDYSHEQKWLTIHVVDDYSKIDVPNAYFELYVSRGQAYGGYWLKGNTDGRGYRTFKFCELPNAGEFDYRESLNPAKLTISSPAPYNCDVQTEFVYAELNQYKKFDYYNGKIQIEVPYFDETDLEEKHNNVEEIGIRVLLSCD